MEASKENNQEQDQDQSQGKPSTAETDVTYQLDAAALRNSPTASMTDTDEDSVGSGEAGNGGVDEVSEDPETTDFGS